MVRTQIQLPEDVARRLPALAKGCKQSVAAFVRDAVLARIAKIDREREEAWQKALSAVGAFDSELGDVSEHHDAYLADDLYERKVLHRGQRSPR